MNYSKYLKVSSLLFPLALVACGGDDNDDRPPVKVEEDKVVSFQIKVTNTTHNQPLAPLAVILHDSSYQAWSIGSPASTGLEMLAESGSPAELVAEATDAFTSTTGDGILLPGESATYDISATLSAMEYESYDLALTLASMPVNTNDAFTGVSAWDVGELMMGDSAQRLLPVYDAGTEFNTETLATVPGPAAGGEGFNEQRDDIADQVTRHPGVVTSADGAADSALDASHKFDQGAMLVTVTRM